MGGQHKSFKGTISARELTRDYRRRRTAAPDMGHARPKTRGQCAAEMRPCPWVRCRHHLFLDAKDNGSLKMHHGETADALFRMRETCSLDAAARGAMDLDECGAHLGVTHERVRQEQEKAMQSLSSILKKAEIEIDANMSDCHEDQYVASPLDTQIRALGLEKEDAWLRKIWQEETQRSEKTPW